MESHTSPITAVVDTLKSSPLYQLSLASKELFHSNFLAWLWELYPDLVAPLFSQYLPKKPETPETLKVDRERKQIDLTISFRDGNQLVIENKVKSIPTVQQLERYSAAQKNKDRMGFLLLSLTRPGFLKVGETSYPLSDGVCWHHLSYRDLAVLLHRVAEAVSEKDTYHGALLMDYIKFILHLDMLQTLMKIDWDDPSGDFFGMQEDLDRIKEIRLHDLIDKLRYADLAWRVKGRLESEGFNDVVMQPLPAGEPGQIAVSSDMTRGVGLFDMKYLLTKCDGGEPVILGVQVQGRHFRLNLQMDKGQQKQSRKIAESLLEPSQGSRIWFNLDSVPSDSAEYP